MSNLEEVEGILQALLQCCQRNSEKIEEKAKNVIYDIDFRSRNKGILPSLL